MEVFPQMSCANQNAVISLIANQKRVTRWSMILQRWLKNGQNVEDLEISGVSSQLSDASSQIKDIFGFLASR